MPFVSNEQACKGAAHILFACGESTSWCHVCSWKISGNERKITPCAKRLKMLDTRDHLSKKVQAFSLRVVCPNGKSLTWKMLPLCIHWTGTAHPKWREKSEAFEAKNRFYVHTKRISDRNKGVHLAPSADNKRTAYHTAFNLRPDGRVQVGFATVVVRNEMGINASVNDRKGDTIEKIIAKLKA